MRTQIGIALVAVLLCALPVSPAAAKTKLVTYADSKGIDVPAPGSNESTIVFIRASKVGGAIAATVYERSEHGGLTMVTASYPNTYTVHTVTPGKHIFAVVSEAADFIEVDAGPGKIYPIVVTPRIGAWKARFSLASACPGTEFADKVHGWLERSSRVVPNEAASVWFDANKTSVATKVDAYWPKWMGKANKPIVKVEDGVAAV